MIVYYVEGDHGHLMGESLQQQQFRTKVRGAPISFHMPWEDILKDLQKNCLDKDLLEIPRPQECLKYILRVHLKVNGCNFNKYLKQLFVRPFVLVLLLDWLIDNNHEVFRNKLSPALWNERMRAAVKAEYPETEGDKPLEEREGSMPASISDMVKEAEDACASDKAGIDNRSLFSDKNAVPGDRPQNVSNCFNDVRPVAVCLDRKSVSASDPAAMRQGAVERFGDMHVQTGAKMIHQWHSKYFSQVMPFVMPRMVSGPDYHHEDRWRRKDEGSPYVSVQDFTAGFCRRIEAPCRTDWTATSIVRH